MESREDLDPTLVEVATVSSGAAEEGSLFDALANERDDLATEHEVDIRIPGYNKVRLFARYRLVDGPALAAIGRKVQKEFKKQYDQVLYASVDVLIAACVGFFYEHDDSGDERKPLTYEGEAITGYSENLARALRFVDKVDPQNPARSVVFGVFGNNEVALQGHNVRLGRWMQDTSVDVDEEFTLGNL